MADVQIGSVLIVDGIAWTVDGFKGHVCFAKNDAGKLLACDQREIIALGAGLFGLPGRIEPKAAPAPGAIVAPTAEASGA